MNEETKRGRGRPKGSNTTIEIKFSDLLEIVAGSVSCKKVAECLINNNLEIVLEQNVTVGIKWAEAKGFKFNEEKIERVITPIPARPKVASPLGEVEEFN